MGLAKAVYPADFLKLVREYGFIDNPLGLNLIASVLPWFEVFCGLLILGGVAVRGAAVVSLAMLMPFTALVWKRALMVQAAMGVPFCSIRFDCGCGAGEVWICHKLIENGLLIMLSLWLLAVRRPGWCLWHSPLDRATSQGAGRLAWGAAKRERPDKQVRPFHTRAPENGCIDNRE